MKGKWKWLVEDRKGISIMQDAILFCIMVSVSGAILMPALVNDTITQTHAEKEIEERAYEYLCTFLNTKADDFEYITSEEFIDTLASTCPFIDIHNPSSLYVKLKKSLFGARQMHKSYGDLCTECVLSQMELFGQKINFLTIDFSESLKVYIINTLDKIISDNYGYNFTCQWRPIKGLNIGGHISIGPTPSGETYTAEIIELIPYKGGFSWIDIRDEIESTPFQQIYAEFLETNDALDFKDEMQTELDNLVCNILFDGYGENSPSVINLTLNCIFIEISRYVSHGFEMINETLALFGIQDIFSWVMQTIEDFMKNLLGINDPSESFEIIKEVVGETAETMYHDMLSKQIEYIIEFIIQNKGSISDTDVNDIIFEWLSDMIGFTEIIFTLTLWEVS